MPLAADRFERKQVMYVRNYNEGFGLRWQEVFQTTERGEVEAYCRKNDITFEWKDGDHLRTRQVRPAIRVNPRTGDTVWFNHAAFFNVAALDPDIYGDGGRIAPADVEHILEATLGNAFSFPGRKATS
jgi:hypothetical protein